MSDGHKVPERNAPPTGSAGSPSPPRTVTNPGGMKVLSAARASPLQKQTSEGPVGKRLASGASNVFLNALSILKEMVQDFRNQDRFFKYKAGIVGGWVFISLVSIVIACPGQGIQTAELGARVTVLPNADKPTASPSLTVTNTGDDPWMNVIFVVNGKYRATAAKVDAGGIFTLTPRILVSSEGKPMGSDERFLQAEMRTDDGTAELVRAGQPLTQ